MDLDSIASISAVNATDLTDNHVVILTIDTKSMPPQRATSYMADVKDMAATAFRPAKIMVIPKTIDVQIVHSQDA